MVVRQPAFTRSKKNPFQIKDIQVFDDETLQRIAEHETFGLQPQQLAYSLQQGPTALLERITNLLSGERRTQFLEHLQQPLSTTEVEQAQQRVLNALFWELTYWKTPELYEELTSGERLHPGIFRDLESDLRYRVILDVGAGSGRASFACLRHGARLVYAIEPSPGLRRILSHKLNHQPVPGHLIVREGRFDSVPLADNSVDIALSCSAFTAQTEQGGEPGLQELQRVTRPGGKIILIWPRGEDRDWLTARGFHYVTLPMRQPMRIRFRSLHSALHCIRHFYPRNQAVLRYVLTRKTPEIPFPLVGMHPPTDYCWLEVRKA
ncbi:MAG TPA: methyltransferase domain-containing protein [Ktedonobacteraceae bacterium]|nr:methyltransferase domain-containing protein [Ktedonobacteraceae bacterium]